MCVSFSVLSVCMPSHRVLFLLLNIAITNEWSVVEREPRGVTRSQVSCPNSPWITYNDTINECVCGDQLKPLVDCKICNRSVTLQLRSCYCYVLLQIL